MFFHDIDSIKLSDLEFIEVEVPKKRKTAPNQNNSTPQQAMTITPQPVIVNSYSQNTRETPQQMISNPRPIPRQQQQQQPPLHKLQVSKYGMGLSFHECFHSKIKTNNESV